MANVRLLRQMAADYQKKIEKVNETYTGAHADYKAAVENYNSTLEKTQAGERSIWSVGDGKYAVFGGMMDGKLQYRSTAKVVDEIPTDFSNAVVDSEGVPVPDVVNWVWVRNPDGTASAYTPQQTGTRQEERKTSDGDTYTVDVPVFGYVPVNKTLTVAPDEPTAPELGKYPRDPFTEKQKGLLRNPTLTPSEMNMASAVGAAGESALAGDQPSGPTSAFANPDDPNNLKEKGVLARVLGGQL